MFIGCCNSVGMHFHSRYLHFRSRRNLWIQIKLWDVTIVQWKTVPPIASICKCYYSKNMFAGDTMPLPICTITEWHVMIAGTMQINVMSFILFWSLNTVISGCDQHGMFLLNTGHSWQTLQTMLQKEWWPIAKKRWHLFIITLHSLQTFHVQVYIPAMKQVTVKIAVKYTVRCTLLLMSVYFLHRIHMKYWYAMKLLWQLFMWHTHTHTHPQTCRRYLDERGVRGSQNHTLSWSSNRGLTAKSAQCDF